MQDQAQLDSVISTHKQHLLCTPGRLCWMASDGPTLPDMLAKVPSLVARCVRPHLGRLQAIKALRLVSKEVGCLAMSGVISCSLQLGSCASLTPRQVVQMMHSARLQNLTVTVITTSGGCDLLKTNLSVQAFRHFEPVFKGIHEGNWKRSCLTVFGQFSNVGCCSCASEHCNCRDRAMWNVFSLTEKYALE